jgi:hypothetical protein
VPTAEFYRTFVFTVELDEPVDHEVRIDFETSDGTATVADNDYLATSGTIVFAANETQKTISVVVNDDSKPELDEMFFVTLIDSQQALLPDNPATGAVINDAFPQFTTVVTGDLTLDLSLDTSKPNNSSCTPTQDGFDDVIGTIRGSDIVINVQVPRGFVLSYQMVGDLNSPTNMTGDITLLTIDGSRASNGIDLLTVLAHELGHVLGLDDLDADVYADDIMADTLPLGTRRLPWTEAVDRVFVEGL